MTLINRLMHLSSTLAARAGAIETAEQVSQGVVMPLLAALGYDVFDPEAVVSDYSVSADRKKSERADHAVMVGSKAAILIKVRPGNAALDGKALSNLATEFSLGSADFVVLVNARWIQVYSDLDQAGVIDLSPFVSLDLHDVGAEGAGLLASFARDGFDGDAIRAKADQVKFGPILQERLQDLLNKPTPAFVSMLLAGTVSGTPGDQLLDRCGQYLRSGYRQMVSDEVRARIARALDDAPAIAAGPSPEAAPEAPAIDKDSPDASPDEVLGLQIIRAIAFGLTEPSDIVLRPNQTYAAILYKDNNRRTVARLHMKRSAWYIGLLDSEQRETRHPITSVENIYAFAEQIRAAVTRHAEAPATDVTKRTEARTDASSQKPSTLGSETSDKTQAEPANSAVPANAHVEPDASAPVAEPEVVVAPEAADAADVEPVVPQVDEPIVEVTTPTAPPADADEALTVPSEPEAGAATDTLGGQNAGAATEAAVIEPIQGADGAPELSLEDFDQIYDEIAASSLGDNPATDEPDAENDVLEALINSPIAGPEGGSLDQPAR